MSEIVLDGCRPTPLAGYLKALGVLRLVAEQADAAVRGYWRGERFHLKTTLDCDALRRFFVVSYRPTPIVAPWNGGSGFYPRDTKEGIVALANSAAGRFSDYKSAIALCEQLIKARGLSERPADVAKTELISAIRAEGSAATVTWLDSAVALALDRLAFPPLLGTGGNDGRLDFTNNFMQRLMELIDAETGLPNAATDALLSDALFARPAVGLSSAAIGQFAPGAAGGPNSGIGFEGASSINAWDFVLMLEGTLVFAGGVSRRLEGASPAYLSYPFTVRAAGAGFGTASFEEQAEARGELWAPLWTRPATYAEVRALFREGRLAVGARPARDGLDAARAVSDLATDRRIAAFERYGFVKRQGLSFLAAPLGRRVVRPNPSAELLTDLDRGGWLDSLRRKAESGEASADLRGAVRGLEDAAFALLERPHDLSAVQATLVAIGRTGRVVAQRPKLRDGVASIAPPPRLSGAWIVAADDGTPAFRLAVALAGVRARLATENRSDNGNGTSGAVSTERRFGLPMCAHLGPLDPDAFPSRPRWSVEKGSALATWGSGSLVDNLCAFARRRLLEWTRLGLDEAPFDGANGADSGEIAAFLDGPEMDSRIAELVLGLSWVEPARWSGERRAAAMPFAYTTLKPLFTPRSVFERLGHETLDLPMPPALAALLAAGRLVDAVRLAQERARASGLPTPFLGRREPPAQSRPTNILLGRRLLAALVIPIRDGVVAACLDQAYPSSDQEPRHAS